MLVCINKVDTISDERHRELREEKPDYIFISAKEGRNLDDLKDQIWERLGLIRIYMKERYKEPDKEEPLIVSKDSTVADVIGLLDKDFGVDLKFAKVWGGSADFPGQKVGKEHELKDEDTLELRF